MLSTLLFHAVVSHVRGPYWYTACSSCHAKVASQVAWFSSLTHNNALPTYRCPKCGYRGGKLQSAYFVKMHLAQGSNTIQVTVFDTVASPIVGLDTASLVHFLDDQIMSYPCDEKKTSLIPNDVKNAVNYEQINSMVPHSSQQRDENTEVNWNFTGFSSGSDHPRPTLKHTVPSLQQIVGQAFKKSLQGYVIQFTVHLNKKQQVLFYQIRNNMGKEHDHDRPKAGEYRYERGYLEHHNQHKQDSENAGFSVLQILAAMNQQQINAQGNSFIVASCSPIQNPFLTVIDWIKRLSIASEDQREKKNEAIAVVVAPNVNKCTRIHDDRTRIPLIDQTTAFSSHIARPSSLGNSFDKLTIHMKKKKKTKINRS